jgi:hypothetical protein
MHLDHLDANVLTGPDSMHPLKSIGSVHLTVQCGHRSTSNHGRTARADVT